ncbi:PKD domain-containing protein [Candidatus Peregrinibacteria bacterium]|nr:PKD domain-containing protein [Candidatus Peregrinibacteria bacterium]
MKKILAVLFLSFFVFASISMAIGFDRELRPVISAKNNVRVEKNIIFDASSSFVLDGPEPVFYTWDFGDGTYERGANVVHTYRKPGNYTVKLTLSQGKEKASVMSDVFAYKKLVLMMTDMAAKKENIALLADDAQKEGTFVHLIESYDSTTAFMSEESIIKKLTEQGEALSNAEIITSWTAGGSGINALSQLMRMENEVAVKMKEPIQGKTIVVISDGNLNSMARILQVHFNIIKPKQIIITREHELKNLIAAPTAEDFLAHLEKSISEYKVINEKTGRVSLLNSISYLVNFMIVKGIPSNTIVLLLMLPIIATLIALIKQTVGITTFGLYLPSIITLSFLALGLKFGLSILIILIVTGAVLRKALDHFRLLHIPRVAIILSITAFIILLMLAAGTYLGISQIATIAVFPMLIMTALAEKFVSALSERGIWGTFLLMLETTAVSLLCYSVVEWQFLQTLMLAHPEIILLLIVINYFLGRWTGLRLVEYLRFKEVMKYTEEE